MDFVVSPAPVGFNKQSGAPKPALQPGQLIDALVLQLIDSGTVRLSVADHVMDVHTTVPLVVGSTVRLAVKGTAADTKLVIVSTSVAGGALSPQPVAAKESAIGATAPLQQIDAAAIAISPVVSERQIPATDVAGALATALRDSATRQSGLAPLYADIAEAAESTALSPPVRQAVAQLLALRPELSARLTAGVLKEAVARSGLFMEARLAAVASDGRPAPTGADDLKAALSILREALKVWSVEQPAAGLSKTSVGSAPGTIPAAILRDAPPPPYRGAPPATQPAAMPLIAPDASPTRLKQVLIAETDGALARMTLLQAASVADDVSPRPVHDNALGQRWMFELPFAMRQGTAVAQFEIARDGIPASPAKHKPVWRANFSLDVEPMGPIHAQVSLTGGRMSVRLWAERSQSAAALRANAGDLADVLRGGALEPAEVSIRDGAPPRPAKTTAAGRFLDRAS